MDWITRNSSGGLEAHGPMAHQVLNNRLFREYGSDAFRPFLGEDGHSYINNRYDPEHPLRVNANSSLPRDAYKFFDDVIVRTSQPNMPVWSALRSRVPRVINEPGVTVIEYKKASNITPASMGATPRRRSELDRIEYEPGIQPIPFIYKDFSIDWVHRMASSRGPAPVNAETELVMAATLECTKLLEQFALGIVSFTYAGGTAQGLGGYTDRNTVNLSDPDDLAWTPELLLQDFLEMIQALKDDGFNGPYDFFLASNWETKLGEDYSAVKGDGSVLERLLRNRKIRSIETVDYLEDYRILGVQMTPNVVEAIVIEDFRFISWSTDGSPFSEEGKVWGQAAPFVKSDIDGNCGIVDATVP